MPPPDYRRARVEFHANLRAFLEHYRVRHENLEFQAFDFILGGSARHSPRLHPAALSEDWLTYRSGKYATTVAHDQISEFNAAFYGVFEPIFDCGSQNLRTSAPLWYVVLEIDDREALHYSCFAYPQRLAEPTGFFAAHRAYDELASPKAENILGLTDLFARGDRGGEGLFHPVMIALDTVATRQRIEQARQSIGEQLRVVVLDSQGIRELDSAIDRSLASLAKCDSSSVAEAVLSTAARFRLRDILRWVDDPSKADGPFAAIWESENASRFVTYLVWLRSLAIAAQPGATRKKNFGTYLYVPWPDLADESTRTITSAFTGWPPAPLLEWMAFDAPMAFQRYEALLPRRYTRQAQEVIAHEAIYLALLRPYLEECPPLRAAAYALIAPQLFFGREPGGDANLFTPKQDRAILPWVTELVDLAWKVHIAKISLDYGLTLQTETLSSIRERPEVLVDPPNLRLAPDFRLRGGDWSSFDWDISRWLLAAVLNAMKHVMTGRRMVDLAQAQVVLPTIRVEVIQNEKAWLRFAVTNPDTIGAAADSRVQLGSQKGHGTPTVLKFLQNSLAGYRDSFWGPRDNRFEVSVYVEGCSE